MAVQSIKELVLNVPMNVQSEMTACVEVLALSADVRKATDDYSAFNDVWDKPEDGLLDQLGCYVPAWTIMQLMESNGT
ncbi:hypothetical protein HGRIS_006531 [Hohenbuehelia grisea]|uniref:Uncharacterized protein n=1 Tax=Hohenbuehelia grisea TaxID=104357 RepID=A0ABR3JAC1_9AGAR